MLELNKPLKLPPQLQWKFAHEPQLLSWTIKARNYNTFWANIAFLIVIAVALPFAYFVHHHNEDVSLPWRIVPSAAIMAIAIMMAKTGYCSHASIAYRITKSGLEYCLWKLPAKWPLTLLKWLTPVVAFIFLFLATVDPVFLLGTLIGPGGMVLAYLSLAHSKTLQEMETDYHHKIYEWADFKALNIATNREIVGLSYSKWTQDKQHLNRWSVNIYCQRKQKEQVAKLLQRSLAPDIPITRLKADIW